VNAQVFPTTRLPRRINARPPVSTGQTAWEPVPTAGYDFFRGSHQRAQSLRTTRKSSKGDDLPSAQSGYPFLCNSSALTFLTAEDRTGEQLDHF